MALTLRSLGPTAVPVEVEGLTPDRLRDKSRAEIERCEIHRGKEKLPLAELFHVAGDASDGQLAWEGDLAGVHWIGAHQREGTTRIHGDAGRHLGSAMRGGEIHVAGSAGDWVGSEMRGGLIHVHGTAGHQLGAALPGSPRGMTGGMILVDGSGGHEIGTAMRRGLIAVGGAAGDLLGSNLIAGSILTFGGCGARPGAGMRRGTIGLFSDASPPTLLPTFRKACRYRPQVLRLMFRQLASYDFPLDPALLASEFDLYSGDALALGKGEVLIRAA